MPIKLGLVPRYGPSLCLTSGWGLTHGRGLEWGGGKSGALRNHQIIATLTLCCCTARQRVDAYLSWQHLQHSYKVWQASAIPMGTRGWRRVGGLGWRQRQITNSTSAKWTTLINFGPCTTGQRQLQSFLLKLIMLLKTKQWQQQQRKQQQQQQQRER